MTAISTQVRHVPDTRRRARLLAALLLPVGPACIALLRFLMPYRTIDSSSEMVRQVSAHPDRQTVCVWLGLAGMLTLVPAVLWVGRVTRRRAPVLTLVAQALLIPGYLVLGFLVAADAVTWYGVTHGIDHQALANLYGHGHPAVAVTGAIFVVGHVLGTVLLGAAMLRSRSVPTWAAVLTIVAQPLHFVAAVIVGSHSLDLIAWGANAVGFAAVSFAILALSDDEWDLPPVQ